MRIRVYETSHDGEQQELPLADPHPQPGGCLVTGCGCLDHP